MSVTIHLTLPEGGGGGTGEPIAKPHTDKPKRGPLLSDMKPEVFVAWRKKHGWTMEEAADYFDIRRERWAEWEAGTYPISLMMTYMMEDYDENH